MDGFGYGIYCHRNLPFSGAGACILKLKQNVEHFDLQTIMMDCKAEVLSVDVDIRAQECECDTQESQDDDEEEEETNNELVSFPYEKCGTFF